MSGVTDTDAVYRLGTSLSLEVSEEAALVAFCCFDKYNDQKQLG